MPAVSDPSRACAVLPKSAMLSVESSHFGAKTDTNTGGITTDVPTPAPAPPPSLKSSSSGSLDGILKRDQDTLNLPSSTCE